MTIPFYGRSRSRYLRPYKSTTGNGNRSPQLPPLSQLRQTRRTLGQLRETRPTRHLPCVSRSVPSRTTGRFAMRLTNLAHVEFPCEICRKTLYTSKIRRRTLRASVRLAVMGHTTMVHHELSTCERSLMADRAEAERDALKEELRVEQEVSKTLSDEMELLRRQRGDLPQSVQELLARVAELETSFADADLREKAIRSRVAGALERLTPRKPLDLAAYEEARSMLAQLKSPAAPPANPGIQTGVDVMKTVATCDGCGRPSTDMRWYGEEHLCPPCIRKAEHDTGLEDPNEERD